MSIHCFINLHKKVSLLYINQTHNRDTYNLILYGGAKAQVLIDFKGKILTSFII